MYIDVFSKVSRFGAHNYVASSCGLSEADRQLYNVSQYINYILSYSIKTSAKNSLNLVLSRLEHIYSGTAPSISLIDLQIIHL